MAKYPCRGVTIAFDTGVSTIPVAQVTEIGGISVDVETLDVTLLGDTYRKVMAVINDAGETTVSGFFDPAEATHSDLQAIPDSQLEADADPIGCQITLTDTDTTVLECDDVVLTNFTIPAISIGEAIRFEATVKANGPWWETE